MSAAPKEGGDSLPRGPIAWMAANPIAANLLMALLIGGGLYTAVNIQKEVYPSFELDVVQIRVSYPGAAPSEVETGILLPIEEAVRSVRGIREISSMAREGGGFVSIELVKGTDRMLAFQDIDQAVAGIRTFPDDIDRPRVRLETEMRRVMDVQIYGPIEPWDLRRLGESLRDTLLSHPDVSQVDLGRVPDYVTHVEISRHRLREHDLTLADVARVIGGSSEDIPAGDMQTDAGEILLRVAERKQWARELADIIVLTSESGTPLRLGDIAEISDGFEEAGFHSQFNGQPSVGVYIQRIGEQSPLAIAAAVHEMVPAFEKTLPEGVRVRVGSSAADDYRDRLSLLLENAALALIIVLAILALFLEIRLAFWVMMGMTISFIGGLILLPAVGVSINMISMFGFLVVLGIVVDDAIVVGENVYEHRRSGASNLLSAVAGTREIAKPVVFSILTNIVAFLPLLFIPGSTGKYWWPLPAVVIAVLLVSLGEALFVLPAHLAHRSTREPSGIERWIADRQSAFALRFDRFVDERFAPLLRWSLRNRSVTLSAAVGLLIVVSAFAYSEHMGMVMMPEVAADEIEAGVRLPVGTTPKQAAQVARRITESTQRMFEEHDLHLVSDGIKTNVRGGSFIDVELVMKPPDERDMTAQEVIQLWRDQIGDIEGVRQITFEAERGPGGWRQDISIDLAHPDIEVLERAMVAFTQRLESFEAVRDVSDNYNKGKAQFDIRMLPEGRALGLTSQEVGNQLRDAFHGALAMRGLRGTNEVEVRVKLPFEEREDRHFLDDFPVRTSAGVEVPLLTVVEVERSEGFTSINRRNGLRAVNVGCDVEPPSAVSRVLESLEKEELPALRADFPGITWSFEGSESEMRDATRMLWGGFALAMAVIFSLLAVAFRSYTQPLIVMGVIPFGIIGAVLGHLLLGYDLSLVSLMGIIALSGVVVNDSLIMIDYANRRRGELDAFTAIEQAGLRRFRPILLTTLTTFGGLTPIILETSNQANHLIPMAISLGFGILVATFLVLLLVPSLYLLVEDAQKLLHRQRHPEY